ncbi:hypothetical protein OTU49_012233, partial [Cherax quadricarinatus]
RILSTATPKEEVNTGPVVREEGSGKHLKITAQNTRLPVIAQAVVIDIREESPTVRGLTLQVDNPDFTFRAGQWVDMFIPGMETVGGFSMYSSPILLSETGTLQLGVKFSRWPPAYWVHKQCKIQSKVAIRAGGDFYYSPEVGEASYDLLLVGGGVGINPLASMFLHANTLHQIHKKNPEKYRPGKILLLYSAKTYEELLYKTLLDNISSSTPETAVQYFTTREQPASASSPVKYGRITQEVLKSAIDSLDTSSLKTFICGPPPMIENINQHLLSCGLLQNQIFYEKWW